MESAPAKEVLLKHSSRGAESLKLNKWEQALSEFNCEIKLFLSSMTFSNRAAALLILNSHEEALEAVNDALKRDPRDSHAITLKK